MGPFLALTVANFQTGEGGINVKAAFKDEGQEVQIGLREEETEQGLWPLERLSNRHPDKVCHAFTTLHCYDLFEGR